ncbi:hypothetical protein BgiBS90_004583, partial [Biomphalaria glabrata]
MWDKHNIRILKCSPEAGTLVENTFEQQSQKIKIKVTLATLKANKCNHKNIKVKCTIQNTSMTVSYLKDIELKHSASQRSISNIFVFITYTATYKLKPGYHMSVSYDVCYKDFVIRRKKKIYPEEYYDERMEAANNVLLQESEHEAPENEYYDERMEAANNVLLQESEHEAPEIVSKDDNLQLGGEQNTEMDNIQLEQNNAINNLEQDR